MYLVIDPEGGGMYQTDRPITDAVLASATVIELSEDGYYYPYLSADRVPYVGPIQTVNGFGGWELGRIAPNFEGPEGIVVFNDEELYKAEFGQWHQACEFANEARRTADSETLTKIEWRNMLTGETFTTRRGK